ncbi:ectonucleotide pyrophosphatase/phosphodiesterase family member 1 [Metarhizium anisopliae]|nr:ectonucleotide pyrophosphatase/phosphodiesterase family member 1 [Metarhizium anisopliae]
MAPKRLDTSQPKGERGDGASLLSPIAYDDDAASLHSRSDQDTDSDDDQLQLRARNSRELRAADRIVLMEEEELDRLVTTSRREQERQRRGSGLSVPSALNIFARRGSSSQLSSPNASMENLVSEKRKARRSRRKQKRNRLIQDARHGEDGELMYEMEEGGMKDGSSTGDSTEREDSGEADRRRLNLVAQARDSRGRSWRRWVFWHSLIAIGFAILVLVAWKLSRNRRSALPKQHLVSNGTALFAPTTIILSLDGFRADFLQRGFTPRLNALVKEGISPQYMMPSFPSLTFPNHFTLATGLYPESHGIVANKFWDPDLNAEFHHTDPARSLDPKWWNGEPFWVTAEKQGIRAAVHMWPGSEAPIQDTFASIVDKYNGNEPLDSKVSRILGFLDMPGKENPAVDVKDTRPQLIAAYVPNVDTDGHKYGPNSTEIMSTIQSVDTMIDNLSKGLDARNLTNIVNVIVVSDHGMATTDTSRVLQLEDLVDTSKIEHIDGWPLYGLRPKDDKDTQQLYDELKDKAKSNPNFDVYLRDVDMPQRYHFAKNHRIAPLWIVPKVGWAIVTKDEFVVNEAKEKGLVYHPRGLHGYDHQHPLMRAIFIARGPAFPHQGNSRVEPFLVPVTGSSFANTTIPTENLEVYNIVCDSLGMEPQPNNGTLRLPLKPVGTHDDTKPQETPEDPPPQESPAHPTEFVPTRPTKPRPSSPAIGVDPPPPPSASASEPSSPAADAHQPTRPTKPKASSSLAIADDEPKRPTRPPKISSTGTQPAAQPTEGSGNSDDEQAADEDGSLADKAKGWWGWITDTVGGIWDSITGSGSG